MMKKPICFFLTLCLLATVSAFAQPEQSFLQTASPDVEQRIRRIENGLSLPVVVKGEPAVLMKIADRMQFYKTPGVSVAFINNGRIEWARGYGVRAVGESGKVTTETLFQAGSISKPVAAAIALRLAQAGKFDLDEDVNRKLKSWKVPDNEFTKQEKVTVRRIVSHSAGLTNHAAGNYAVGAPLPTLAQILDGVKPANTAPIRVDYVPGSRWRYSGGGYGVLQQLIVDVGGKPFPKIAQEIVFDRLKMRHTTFEQPLPERFQNRAAVGHNRAGEKIVGDWIVFPEMAAAGLWSTPSDLARFALELQQSKIGKSSKLLTVSTTDQMLARQIENWGLGFVVEGAGHSARFSHAGDTEGYKCLLVMYQNNGQGAVVMTNSDRGDRLIGEIVRSIAKEYGWQEFQPKEKTIAKIDPRVFADYAGQYQFEFSADFTLAVGSEANNLTTELKQPTGQSKAVLHPESETKFFRRDVDIEITFVRDETNRVTHLIFRQDGQELRAKRVK